MGFCCPLDFLKMQFEGAFLIGSNKILSVVGAFDITPVDFTRPKPPVQKCNKNEGVPYAQTAKHAVYHHARQLSA